MDRDRSFERRYSFNASAIRNPAAESTKLNNSNANRSGLGSSFKWGSSPISPKQRYNSSANLINFDSTVGSGDHSFDKSRCRSIRKIDPRIVADVQSKGLASRIVKYHENGTRLNRSMSAHNLYTKPGQFPVVTLKKTDLPFRASKQNVSMTRIAPPEKSVFYGNTLSSLLRSNSIVGLQKTDEDISRENRPILHPPPNENDMAPTRSVLDVLKEISRKRINSDDPDVVETSKKNRIGNDLVDTGAQTIMTQSYKRQRDLNTPNINNGEVISPSKPQASTLSPEQAKKRVCNYNNDITSSLSSSIKRKPNVYKRPSYQMNQTMPTRLESYEIQKNKTPRMESHLIAGAAARTTTPTSTNINTRFGINQEKSSPQVGGIPFDGNITSAPESNGYGTIPTRSKSEPAPYESDRRQRAAISSKPRLTLFNKAYEVDEKAGSNENLDEDSNEILGECAGIQFVKPKKTLSSGLKNPILERAQKSKLALMLSGLRGELYIDNELDELDSPAKAKQQSENKVIQEKTTAVPTTTIVSLTSTSITSSSASITTGAITNSISEKPNTANNSNTQFSMKAPPRNSSPLVGLKLSPPTTTAAPNVTDIEKPEEKLNSSTPILQGFGVSTAAATTSAPAPALNTSTSISFGATTTQPSFALKPVTSTNSNAPKTSDSVNPLINISFGNVAKPITATTTSAPAPTFTFGTTTNSTSSATAPANTFTFGTPNSSSITAPNLQPTLPTFAASVTPSTTVSAASTTFSNTFTFGSSTTAPTAAATQPTSTQSATFGTQAPTASTQIATFGTTSTAASTTPAPSFGIQSSVTTSTSTPAFTFGTTTAQTNKPNNSLSATSIKPSTGTFSFGNTTTAPAANTQLSFGTLSNNTAASSPATANAFTFGSTNNDKTATTLFSAGTGKSAVKMGEQNKSAFSLPLTSTPAPVFGSATNNNTASNIFGNTNSGTQQNLFGSANSQPQQSLFGSTPVAKPTFGTEANKPTVSTTPSLFGGSAPSAFGQTTPNNTLSTNKPASTTGGFSFGSTAPTAATPASNPSTGAAFTFGGSTNTTHNTNNNSSGAASNQPNKPFTFGGSASTTTNDKNSASNIFGGSTSVAPKNSGSGGFSFGSNTAATQKPNESSSSNGAFSFGSATNANTIQKPTAAFTFGATNSNPNAGNNSINSSTAGGFSFGSAMQQKTNDTMSTGAKPFAFGSPSTNNSQVASNNSATTNMFASNMINKPAAAPAFNFGSTSTSTPQAAVAPTATTNNIFAPTPVGSASGDRPIRRATRRLQK